ncbi:MAG: DUF302 domain-containing protein [Rhizobiaceae bacterium]|nr:DUF302 domain-containing protein [Rhizobiaceae bacterium]
MKRMFAIAVITISVVFSAVTVSLAGTEKSLKRDGWITYETDIPFADLYPRLKEAIKTTKLRQITTASASAGAKGRGLTIPGNRVVGVYNNFFAVRMLEASIAAGIEAPLRFYLTEHPRGGSNLTYKIPTEVFRPYFEEGGKDLKAMARELDGLLDQIARETVKE